MILSLLTTAIADAFKSLGLAAPANISLERPANLEHGDWSTNVALANAKTAGKNPRELAAELVSALNESPPALVQSIDIAGPGFINFKLHDAWLHDVLREVVTQGESGFARTATGAGGRVNVEFVSSNPNKPMHAGHARGACYGDSVARLLERCGYEVVREFYLNDRGVQMGLFADSLAARKRGESPPDDGYLGEYLIEWAAEMPDDAEPLDWGRDRAITSIRETLARVGVEHDVWFSERSMVDSGAIDVALADLAEHGATYQNDGATWLRSSDFGDDKDRVLIKSDGDFTYLAPDIAYHRDKFSRSPKLINVWGADHHGYVSRMKAAMQALGHDPQELEILITQLVDLQRDGEPVRMAGRSGDMVLFDDVIDAVGPDAARFTYLIQSVDSRQTIDLDLIASQAMDNPVFYVQYANARIHSVLARAAEAGHRLAELDEADLTLLTHERELDVLRSLAAFPETVEHACNERAPHMVANHLRELAAAFHSFYHDCYVIGDDVSAELTQARLQLLEATRIGLAIGFDLLGVSAPESM